MRTTQIKCRARLASRLPPRLRRCLTTLPEDASTGETPQRLAKEASLFNLSGLSRPRSTAPPRGRCRRPAGRATQGRPVPPADRAGHPTRLSPRRGPRSGGPPNGAQVWLPPPVFRAERLDAGGRNEPPGREPAQAVTQGV